MCLQLLYVCSPHPTLEQNPRETVKKAGILPAPPGALAGSHYTFIPHTRKPAQEEANGATAEGGGWLSWQWVITVEEPNRGLYCLSCKKAITQFSCKKARARGPQSKTGEGDSTQNMQGHCPQSEMGDMGPQSLVPLEVVLQPLWGRGGRRR